MKRKVKIGEVIFTVLFVFALVFVFSVIVKLAKGQVPTFFGYSIMFVETDSMEPDIPAKTLILVKERDFEKEPPKENEVVCFYSDKYMALITHRVIEVGDGFVITKGDNASGADGEIALDKVKFSHVCNITFLSGFVKLMRQPLGFVLIVIIPCICVLGMLVFNIFKTSLALTKSKNEEDENKRIEDIKKQAIEDYIKNHKDNE